MRSDLIDWTEVNNTAGNLTRLYMCVFVKAGRLRRGGEGGEKHETFCHAEFTTFRFLIEYCGVYNYKVAAIAL